MGSQVYLFISQPTPFAEHVGIFARVTHKFALEKGDVEAGGIVVDKLEEEHLHCQLVLILHMGFRNLCGQ